MIVIIPIAFIIIIIIFTILYLMTDSEQQNEPEPFDEPFGFDEPKPLLKEYVKKYFTQPTYDNLLQDKRWQNKRNEILQRDEHKCSYCGSKINLQVHHKYYNKYPDGKKVKPWDYPNDALITLCNDCHKKVHKNKKIKTYYRSKKVRYN